MATDNPGLWACGPGDRSWACLWARKTSGDPGCAGCDDGDDLVKIMVMIMVMV
jgi:hypothetical protein